MKKLINEHRKRHHIIVMAQSVDKVGVGALAPAPLFFSDETSGHD